MRVMRYPVGAAAKQYAADVKPVLVQVAKRLGYTVGSYSGHGSPSVTLRRTDAQSPIDCVVLYFDGYDLEAGVRSRKWRAEMATERGRMVHAMSFGVHEAYGRSCHADLRSRIEQALTNAESAFAKAAEQEVAR